MVIPFITFFLGEIGKKLIQEHRKRVSEMEKRKVVTVEKLRGLFSFFPIPLYHLKYLTKKLLLSILSEIEGLIFFPGISDILNFDRFFYPYLSVECQ